MSKRSDPGISSVESVRPRTRQRIHKPPPVINVPDIDEDAAERKRVLNVLAQRRYRQRKRQSRLVHGGDSADNPAHDSGAPPPCETAPVDDGARENSETAGLGDLSSQSIDSIGLEFIDPQWTTASFDELSMPTSLTGDGQFSSILFGDIDFAFDSAPSDDTGSWTMDSGTGAHSQGTVSTADASCTSSSAEGDQGSNESFPDSYLLPVNELTLLRAALRVADRLNAQSLWDLTASSPFNLGTSPPTDQLPPAWQPTTSQLLVPHHPVIDLLPWPSCRDRILDVLSLPDDARPPTARGALALVNFIYDMEDSAEGIRIWGSDPYDEKGWEVGQVVFERWWFIFDRGVIERSNHWRRLRGAPILRISGNTTIGPTIDQRVRVTEE